MRGETSIANNGSLLTAERGAHSAAIAARLRRAIVEGSYAYGDRLPPERELARSLGTSRTTLRSALRLLEEHQLIERRAGSGTYVTLVARGEMDEKIAEITSPLELMEVRMALEPEVARFAVMHGTTRDIEQLSRALLRVEAAVSDPDVFTKYDEAFHLELALATHNPLIVSIYRQINHVRGATLWSAFKDKILTPSRIESYNAEHRAVFEAISRRDAKSAMELISRHLAGAHRDLLGVESV